MGMDLVPRRSGAESLHYNWSGWRALIDFLNVRDVDTSEFAGTNDGFVIRVTTARAVAKAIEDNPDAYNATYGGTPKPMGYGDAPAVEHANIWRNSGGFRQC